MELSPIKQIVRLARKKGFLRSRDLAEIGLSRQYLGVALKRGLLNRVGRGVYCLPKAMQNEYRSFAEVCKYAPSAVICLLSALQYHGLTTQTPFQVWLAIGHKARKPNIDTVQIRVVRYSASSLSQGIEIHNIDGVDIRVFSPAKTVADCFKYRSKVGLDVAIEALRDCLRQKKAAINDLVSFGRVCRVEQVMKPYMEAML
ncbi:MAG: transcriptional regulator [Candidatus Glassbacteria bacterium RIFCSPLOWO2_12_FULL_58_11]|uniref:Transcriptional regulator n=1 Tax=Candidatus Glassbacteria bacterium RIFCSPLOWO2_12_FULL_58_11 TaxID=1817867 RepID=A0A1F5YZ01_9BACT|nr:MAG: transcriptional regulator [Candidatus Glassbacteria bacterium RIFCSPLOWO2_12_FULL_58_11]